MILTQKETKRQDLFQVFSNSKLAFNSDLIGDNLDLINQYEIEKELDYSAIESFYSETTKTVRRWWLHENKKTTLPYEKVNGEWAKNAKIHDENNWLPYRNQDLNLVNKSEDVVLLHEGEKATDYARACGLISLCFVGAKSQSSEFVKSQLLWLKSQGIKGAYYLVDNDDAGLRKGKEILKISQKINFPILLIFMENLIVPECPKGGDFADLVKDSAEKIKQLDLDYYDKFSYSYTRIQKNIAQSLNGIITKNLQILEDIKITLEEAKEAIEELFQSDLNDVDLNINIENVRLTLDNPVSQTFWQKAIVSPLKQKFRKERAKLDFQLYLQTDDPFDKVSLQQRIQQTYGYSKEQFHFLLKAVENFEITPSKQIDTLEELLADDEEQKWLFPSLLPVGETLLITAAPKTGKSILASDMMRALITGGEFLGEKIKRGKILYCYSDEGRFSFKSRLRLMGFDLPEIINEKNKDNLRGLRHLDLFNLSSLEKHIEDYRPDLIVLDSLRSISSSAGLSENDNIFVQHLYNVKKILDKYSCTTILVHHDNKNGETSGNLGIEGTVWGVAQLTNEQGTIVNDDCEIDGGGDNTDFDNQWSEDYRILHLKRARSAEPQKWKLFLNHPYEWTEKGIYEFLGDADDKTGKKQDAIDKISRLLKNNPDTWLEPLEINSILNLARPTLYRALTSLERSQKIKKKRSENNRKAWCFKWALVDTNSQQGGLVELPYKQEYNKNTPSPTTAENEAETKAENYTQQEPQSFSSLVSSESHFENENQAENDLRMIETEAGQEIETLDNFDSQESDGGGMISDDEIEVLESDIIPYCKEFSFIGAIVWHFKTPEILGEIISEPVRGIGIKITVNIKWFEPRLDPDFPNEPATLEDTFSVTALRSESFDFKAWYNKQKDGEES